MAYFLGQLYSRFFMGINLNYLEAFLSLSQTLSFSKTAIELKIAQPAVSRQIKNLEGQLGTQLFIRNKQGVSLSKEGQQLMQEISPLIKALNESLNFFSDQGQLLSGPISFGVLTEVGEKIFLPIINRFKKKYPDVVIHLSFLKGHEIVEALQSGKLDFGVTPTPLLQEHFRAYEILKEESYLMSRKENVDSKFNIEEAKFVAYRREDPLLLQYIKKFFPRIQHSKINYAFTVNSHKSMLEVLLQHDLFAVLPKLSVQKELDSDKLKISLPHKLISKLFLCHSENELMEKRKKLFKEFIMQELKQLS